MRRCRFACVGALLLALLLTGCGKAGTAPEDGGADFSETEQVETPEAADALTVKEIAQVNEAFAPFKERENVSYVNSVCSFFTSYYERPEDLDLVEFLRYMGIGGTVEDEAEFQALKGAGGWPFQGVDSLDRMPVPIHRYRRTELDAYLEEHADITTADLTNVPESSGELVYLPETDAFYNFTSDAGPGMFICEAGRWEGKLLVLTGGGKELTLEAAEDGALVVPGMIASQATQTEEMTVRRSVPEMDFVIESGNRLWGCRYGVTDGKAVNEIYASKLGDFKNWNCYAGRSTDSYAATRGSDGPFTGAADYLGSPLFFKEDCVERVYPSAAGAHQIVTVRCPGVRKGSGRSLQTVEGVLYYHGCGGVYAFDGSMPQRVSQALGEDEYHGAVAGGADGKYYLSVLDAENQPQLLVYDVRQGLWHREDDLRAVGFAVSGGVLYAMTRAGDILALKGGGTVQEEPVAWRAETGDLGLDSGEGKYLVRLSLRLRPEEGSAVRVAVSYDEGETWQEQGGVTGSGRLRDCVLHVRPRRCRRLRLRIYGVGGCRVYSLTAVYEKGSDGP